MGLLRRPMSIIPPVRASLAERYLFNFRLPLQVCASYLPTSWLIPEEIRGFGVVSFCILDLRGITVAPLPTAVGLTSISCASRFAVWDTSGEQANHAVFVPERQTNSAFGSWFTRQGFSAPHPHVEAAMEHEEDQVSVRVSSREKGLLFSAVVRPSAASRSELFSSSREFAGFIAQGISSYGTSRHGSRLTKVDLYKDDADYTPMAASELRGVLPNEWQSHGGVFDSAFHTLGGRYEWVYHGMTES